METSTPLPCCTLSSAADALLMGCSAQAEANFQVDDLLDFPMEDNAGDDCDYGNMEAPPALGSPVRPHATANSCSGPPLPVGSIQLTLEAAAALHDADEPSSYGLCVPPDELVHQLEWLSSFNEDNFFTGSDGKLLSTSAGTVGVTCCMKDARAGVTPHRGRDDFHSRSPVSVLEQGGHVYALNDQAQRGTRVRKARTGGRVWSLDILKPILLENRPKSSYESTSLLVTSCSSTYSEPLCLLLQSDDSSERPYKKIRRVRANVDAAMDSVFARRCTHCLVQKTPQWRAGPLGPKTLCNACGVRYKSGRLVPEYRPAASPSFVNEVHSNSHRRILEMRRAKEGELHTRRHKSSRAERERERERCPASEKRESEAGFLCDDAPADADMGGSKGETADCGEGSSGGEDALFDGAAGGCEAADIALLDEPPSHEVCEPLRSTFACKEERLQEGLRDCNDVKAVCGGKSLCEEVASVEHATSSGILPTEKHQGCKLEGRDRSEENAD